MTGWAPHEDDFPLWTWDSDAPGEEWITFSAEDLVTGDYRIGTLTVHCVSEEECATALDFVEDGPEASKLFDDWGHEVPVAWEDGTFRCAEVGRGRLIPRHSGAPFCNTTEVEVWVHATNFKAGQIRLTYDPTCADVTGWAPHEDDFPLWTWDSDAPGEEWITFSAEDLVTGDYRIGTLTVHCVSEEECATALDFVEDGPEASKLFDDWGHEVPVAWEDGTFRCAAGMRPWSGDRHHLPEGI